MSTTAPDLTDSQIHQMKNGNDFAKKANQLLEGSLLY